MTNFCAEFLLPKITRCQFLLVTLTKGKERVSVVVAGGLTNHGYESTVEILDPESREWRFGSELPSEMSRWQFHQHVYKQLLGSEL